MNDVRNIHEACRDGNVDLVILLLAEKCNIEAPNENNQRPIHIACDNGHVDIAKLLIEEKCDIEARDKNNQRSIDIACRNGNVDIVRLLLTEKCNIEARDGNDWRPIHFACRSGNVHIVELLLTNECNIEAHNKNGERPAHIAFRNGNVEIVKLLMTKGCDIEARDKNDQRPIHIACRNGNADMVKLLLIKKCDIEACDKNNQRPIHIACRNGNVEIVRLLLGVQCDIESRDKSDEGSIHIACDKESVQIVRLLLRVQCNIEARDKNDHRPIHFACDNGNVAIVKLLIAHKCDIEARDKDDKSPMDIAVQNKHDELISILDQESVKRKSNDGVNVHAARQDENVDNVELLIEEESGIERSDEINHGDAAIVNLLSTNKCDNEASDEEETPPMDIAEDNEHDELIGIQEYESAKRKLIAELDKMSITECDPQCSSTKSCPKNPIPTDPRKQTLLGKGAFGKVYKFSDPNINFHYSVKSIRLNEGRINEEVKCVEKDILKYRDVIIHPQIIEYLGFIKCSRKIYIFMEFAPNGSLHDEIDKVKPIAHEIIIRYSKQILEGIEFLHDMKILHRDIKPQNILLDEKNNIKLCDFGTSRPFSTITVQRKGAVTKTFCGTVNYMAPEVINPEDGEYSFPADIWSTGATIVHMLTGQPPYSDLAVEAAIMFRIATTRKIEYTPQEPMTDNMKSFMEGILNPDPSNRLTAKELLHFLDARDMV